MLNTIKNVTKYSECIEGDIAQETSRNRTETRVLKTYAPNIPICHLGYIYDQDWRKYIKVVIKLHRTRIIYGYQDKQKINKKSIETSYFVATTATYNAKQLNQIIRNHWSVENKNHHVRDTTLEEDKSRIRKNPGVFARIRSFALNILNYKNEKNIKKAIYKNTLDCEEIIKFVQRIG